MISFNFLDSVFINIDIMITYCNIKANYLKIKAIF